jgi:hypothetical protein
MSAVSLKRLSDERSLPVQWSAPTGADGLSDWKTHRGTATTTVGTVLNRGTGLEAARSSGPNKPRQR